MKPALWAEIHRLREFERLSIRGIARRLHCARKTVRQALELENPPLQTRKPSTSIVDPFKPEIERLIARTPELSAVRILEELRKIGYAGEVTLVRNHLREIRPRRGRVYQEVVYEPGQAMQVDWGYAGLVRVGATYRKVWVFVAVLCYSRLAYIRFTLSQSMQCFFRSIRGAVECFGGCPLWIIVDNLKTAVLRGSGRLAVFHPEFEALCAHYRRMRPVACEKADPETKGVVECGVGYVKKNALLGRKEELETFEDYERLAVYWREMVANVRKHATTGERPVDRFEKEREHLRPLPDLLFDTDDIVPVVASSHARVRFDTNRYSVPSRFARKQLTLRADDHSVWVIHGGAEIARHKRSYEKGLIVVAPEHRLDALSQGRRSVVREIEARFDNLGPEAKAFRVALLRAPLKTTVHLKKILELVTLYGKAEVLGAISRALEYGACDAAYVRNLIDQERRRRHLPSPAPITPKRRELLEEVQIEEPDPSDYDHLLERGTDHGTER